MPAVSVPACLSNRQSGTVNSATNGIASAITRSANCVARPRRAAIATIAYTHGAIARTSSANSDGRAAYCTATKSTAYAGSSTAEFTTAYTNSNAAAAATSSRSVIDGQKG